LNAPKTRDYFAEMYVAGMMAEAGWDIYFPRRDKGFDFIVSKNVSGRGILVRPVQVKGKYPESIKKDKATYGFVGKLTAAHPDMVLAIPFFPVSDSASPACTAFMSLLQTKRHSRGIRCEPAKFHDGRPSARRDYIPYFENTGILRIESLDWGKV
jgi:hypothetical protein